MTAKETTESDVDESIEKPEITKIETSFTRKFNVISNYRIERFEEKQKGDIEYGTHSHSRDDCINRITIHFENGARLAYWHREKDVVEQRIYYPGDRSPMETTDIELHLPRNGVTAQQDFVSCVEQSIDVYQKETLEQMKFDWTSVYEAVTN